MRLVFTILLTFISIILLKGNIFGGDNRSKGVYEGDNRSYKGQPGIPSAILNYNSNTRVADYNNLENCLEAIKENTASNLEIITNQPSEITGFLSNGEHFGCVEKVTDEKGTYVHGWYTVK